MKVIHKAGTDEVVKVDRVELPPASLRYVGIPCWLAPLSTCDVLVMPQENSILLGLNYGVPPAWTTTGKEKLDGEEQRNSEV